MVKTNKFGLIGRCFLAGAMLVGGTLGGCQPLSYVQEQRLGTLTGLAIHNQEQKARNEAIREAGTQGHYQGKDSRLYGVNSPEEVTRRKKIMMKDNPNSPERIAIYKEFTKE